MTEKIAIAADHGGFELKRYLLPRLVDLGYEVLDLGASSYENMDDFPDYAGKLAGALKNGDAGRGVLICGTGIGMSIAINRYEFIRGALVQEEFSARGARLHNDANVIVLGGRVIGPELALDCVKVFLETEFLGGKYQDRMEKAVRSHKI